MAEDIEGSVAHARALHGAGIVSAAELEAVEAGLAAVGREIEAGAFVPVDADEDVHMAIERRLTELVGDAGARLHTGRSRNDQVVTDVRLHLRRVAERQDAALASLQEVLLSRAADHIETVLPAYTHLQRAQVTSLAQHLLAYFWMLERDRTRFEAARQACLELPLGAGAAVGLDFDLDREAEAADLGFERVAENSLDAVANRDFVVDYLSAAAQLGAHISRLGAELVLWSTAEFGFVRLPDAYAGGSSIMPQKKNPDAAELMRAAAPRLNADLAGLLGVLHGLPLAYNTDLREDKRYLFDAVDCLDQLLPVVRGLARGGHASTRRAWRRPAIPSWPPPTSPTTSWRRACPSARRTTSPAAWCAAASSRARTSPTSRSPTSRRSRRPSTRATTRSTSPPRSWRANARAAAPRPRACASSSSARAPRSPRAPAADAGRAARLTAGRGPAAVSRRVLDDATMTPSRRRRCHL